MRTAAPCLPLKALGLSDSKMDSRLTDVRYRDLWPDHEVQEMKELISVCMRSTLGAWCEVRWTGGVGEDSACSL